MRIRRHSPLATRILRWCAYSCLLAGAIVLLLCVYLWADAHVYQALQRRRLNDPALSEPVRERCQPLEVGTGSPIGRLEIPRISLSVVVLEGDDARTLRLGAGRVPGTARPGEGSNMAIAAHRDTFFRALRDIRQGDIIRFTSKSGAFVYQVDSTEIVTPGHVEVLDATPKPTLTLITCYPFFYFGSAPERLVVRARLISSEPRSGANGCSREIQENHSMDPLRNFEIAGRVG